MSAEATAWAKDRIARIPMSPASRRTLLAIAGAHLKKTGAAELSYEQITDKTQDDRSTAIRAVKKLIALGLIAKDDQRNGQRRGANIYTILRVALCHPQNESSGSQFQTSEMGGTTPPSEISQGGTTPPPNARARAEGGDLASDGLSLEEMERHVWGEPVGRKKVGGRDV